MLGGRSTCIYPKDSPNYSKRSPVTVTGVAATCFLLTTQYPARKGPGARKGICSFTPVFMWNTPLWSLPYFGSAIQSLRREKGALQVAPPPPRPLLLFITNVKNARTVWAHSSAISINMAKTCTGKAGKVDSNDWSFESFVSRLRSPSMITFLCSRDIRLAKWESRWGNPVYAWSGCSWMLSAWVVGLPSLTCWVDLVSREPLQSLEPAKTTWISSLEIGL